MKSLPESSSRSILKWSKPSDTCVHIYVLRRLNVALTLCAISFVFSEAYTLPEEKKRRRTTVMEQVSTLVSATVAQLREMDAAMQAQEDARLQRLMDHEREMQTSLLSQLAAMHEQINKENHQRHLELVDRILTRVPPGP